MSNENNEELISSAINELVSYYSSKEGTNGIIKEVNNDVNGMIVISLTITYTDLIFETNEYFGFIRKLEDIFKKTNVKILFGLRDSCEYGMLDIYHMQCGKFNKCDTLIDGDILFDRTGKYKDLQKIAKKLAPKNNLRRVRIPKKKA